MHVNVKYFEHGNWMYILILRVNPRHGLKMKSKKY